MRIEDSIKTNNKENMSLLIYVVALLFLFVVFSVLFYRMTVCESGILGNYYSDIRFRLDLAQGDSSSSDTYSLFLIPEFFFCNRFGEDVGAVLIALYLSLFMISTILIVFILLNNLCPNTKKHYLYFLSIVCMFFAPISIPTINPLYATYSGSVWHNETYIGMRFFAVLFLLFFYRTCDHYIKGWSAKVFFMELFLITLVNWVKPNFTIAFAPAMLIMMIIDIFESKGKGFISWIMYGLPILIGALVFLYQYSVLFSQASDGTKREASSSVIFVLGDMLLLQEHPFVVFFLSNSLPLVIALFHHKDIIESKFHKVCYLSWLFSFLEYAFLAESGERMYHGNFSWGIHFFSFLLFCLSVGFWVNDAHFVRAQRNIKKSAFNTMFIIESFLLLLHFLMGLEYFFFVALGRCAYTI